MGGAAGHMSHPFDDKDLTFKDLKKIIKKSFDGELDCEDGTVEPFVNNSDNNMLCIIIAIILLIVFLYL